MRGIGYYYVKSLRRKKSMKRNLGAHSSIIDKRQKKHQLMKMMGMMWMKMIFLNCFIGVRSAFNDYWLFTMIMTVKNWKIPMKMSRTQNDNFKKLKNFPKIIEHQVQIHLKKTPTLCKFRTNSSDYNSHFWKFVW